MTKAIRFFSSLFVGTLLSGLLLAGCKQADTDTPRPVKQETVTEPDTVAESEPITEPEPIVEPESADLTKSITISVLNLSNIQVGMFSVIDPATGEQKNLDSLEPGQSVTMECNWPSDVTNFQWALYNQNGELCIDASTDIAEAKESVVLVLTGEDNLEDVKVLFDKELSDSE